MSEYHDATYTVTLTLDGEDPGRDEIADVLYRSLSQLDTRAAVLVEESGAGDTWIVIADGPDYDAPEAYGPFTEGTVAQRFSNGLLRTLEQESGEGRVHTYVARLRAPEGAS